MIQTKEEAINFISETEQIINNPDQIAMFAGVLIGKWGNITDRDSFKNFFTNYLNDCPNSAIVEGVNINEDANALWEKIDVNKNGKLDEGEQNLVIIEIMKHSLGLVKKYFKI
jgi:hypothetical protein